MSRLCPTAAAACFNGMLPGRWVSPSRPIPARIAPEVTNTTWHPSFRSQTSSRQIRSSVAWCRAISPLDRTAEPTFTTSRFASRAPVLSAVEWVDRASGDNLSARLIERSPLTVLRFRVPGLAPQDVLFAAWNQAPGTQNLFGTDRPGTGRVVQPPHLPWLTGEKEADYALRRAC